MFICIKFKNKKNYISLFLLIFILLFSIIKCSSINYSMDSIEKDIIEIDNEYKNLSYLDKVSIGVVNPLINSSDPSFINIKNIITNNILAMLKEIDIIILPNRLLTAKRDASELRYNFENSINSSNNLLATEIDSYMETEEEEITKEEETEEEEITKEEETEEEEEKSDYINIVNDIDKYIFVSLKEEPHRTIMPELLGKNASSILNEGKTTYNVETTPNIIIMNNILEEDFENKTKLMAKMKNINKDILITFLVKIDKKNINIEIVIFNNLITQIIGNKLIQINKMDYQKGIVDINNLVWTEIKKMLLYNNYASLKISLNIDNALIYINDRYAGRTRKVISKEAGKKDEKYIFNIDVIESGTHKIKITKDGYEEIKGYIFLENDKISILNYDLVPLESNSSIFVYVNEPFAEIWINMEYVGLTELQNKEIPFKVPSIKKGIHKVRVEKQGFNPVVVEVTVNGRDDEFIFVDLINYNPMDFNPDLRSENFRWWSYFFVYSSALSLAGTVSLFYKTNSLEDQLYSLEYSDNYGIDSPEYYNTRENFIRIRNWKDNTSYLTVIFIVGAITFKWLELEYRDIQIGINNKYYGYTIQPTISFNGATANGINRFSYGLNFNLYF